MMKRIGIGVAGVLLIGTATFFAGPRMDDEVQLKPTDLPTDLDAYLVNSERAIKDIRPGTQKEIIWANPDEKSKTPVSLVYIHGFTASRGEVFPLCDSLAAELGANLFYTRLAGHGISGEAVGTSSFEAWANDAYEAYRIGQRIGEQVVVIATSMGGALTTWLMGQKETTAPMALVLISPCYGLYDEEGEQMIVQLTQLPWSTQIAKWTTGEYIGEKKEDPDVDYFWTSPYKTKALLPLGQVIGATRELDYGAFEFPLFMIYSPNDKVVSAPLIAKRYTQFGSSYKDSLQIVNAADPKDHVLAGKYLSPNTTDTIGAAIINFLKPLLEKE